MAFYDFANYYPASGEKYTGWSLRLLVETTTGGYDAADRTYYINNYLAGTYFTIGSTQYSAAAITLLGGGILKIESTDVTLGLGVLSTWTCTYHNGTTWVTTSPTSFSPSSASTRSIRNRAR